MRSRSNTRRMSPGWIIGLAIISVLLLLIPGGIYAGIVLAALVLATVLLDPAHRRDPRMLAASGIALVATVGALIASSVSG